MIENLEYNSDREHLIIPEYGRHLQKMVSYCKSVEDKEERNKVAKSIIAVMGNLQPHLRDVPDFQHKLWDQLFIMADFDLDVDSPYPITTKEELTAKPERLPYSQKSSRYRYYGNNIKKMIQVAIDMEEPELKKRLIWVTANHMKKCFLSWNKDTVDDEVIVNQLYQMSDGKIDKRNDKEFVLTDTSKLLYLQNKTNNKKNQHKKPSKNNNKKYKKRSY